MKKRILTAGFFAFLVLLMPLTAATQIPLTKEELKELHELAKVKKDENVKAELEEILERIITDEDELDVDALEQVMQEYKMGNEKPVFNTDLWQWIMDRLGWIYYGMNYSINIYHDAVHLRDVLNYKIYLIDTIFLEPWRAWKTFKAGPTRDNLTALVAAVTKALYTLPELWEDVTDGEIELIEALNNLTNELNAFRSFLEGNPWMKPITIQGSVSGFEGNVTVSCKNAEGVVKDSITTSDVFTLNFTTADEPYPWWVHKCIITVSIKDGEEKSKNRYAFSMGKIEVDFKASDDTPILGCQKLPRYQRTTIKKILRSSILDILETKWLYFLHIILRIKTIA
jgi:hypothetical protein